MAETKKKARRRNAGKPAKSASQIVVTLSVPQGEVIKVERLAGSGQRRKVSGKELAALAGTDEMEDLGAALEETYAAGVIDAIEDSFELDESLDGDTDMDRFIRREAAGREFVRRGVHRLILRRALRRGLAGKRSNPARKPTQAGGAGQHPSA